MASGFVVRPFASLLLLLLFCMCMCGRFECVRVCVCVCVECLTSRNIGAERRRLLCHDRRRGRYEIDRPFLSAPVLLCLRSSLCLTLILSLSLSLRHAGNEKAMQGRHQMVGYGLSELDDEVRGASRWDLLFLFLVPYSVEMFRLRVHRFEFFGPSIEFRSREGMASNLICLFFFQRKGALMSLC